MERFVGLWDLHYGFERRGGHKVPLHDTRALNAALAFIADFKPHHIVLGGDMLDCGPVSHHNKKKPGATEGLRILSDAKELREVLIDPLEAAWGGGRLVYHVGNHEDWLDDVVEAAPSLDGLLDVRSLLGLDDDWEVIPVGECSKIGKLVFAHGDQVKGGVHSAKWAVEAFERNIRFGHYHTYQTFTKTSALDLNGHSGTCVPCLCKKGPKYGGGSPNKWMQGFLSGHVDPKTGLFNDAVNVIVNGQFIGPNGKLYKG